ncbi:hypothetical protein QL285_008071 [Trifolium repens]|nr:hypothetical protein QL285_008071 [Trifolium repens]
MKAHLIRIVLDSSAETSVIRRYDVIHNLLNHITLLLQQFGRFQSVMEEIKLLSWRWGTGKLLRGRLRKQSKGDFLPPNQCYTSDHQPYDVSNHANGTTRWELTLVIAQRSNESDEAANSLF